MEKNVRAIFSSCSLVQISRASAGAIKRSKDEIANDPEEEDEFGYTMSESR